MLFRHDPYGLCWYSRDAPSNGRYGTQPQELRHRRHPNVAAGGKHLRLLGGTTLGARPDSPFVERWSSRHHITQQPQSSRHIPTVIVPLAVISNLLPANGEVCKKLFKDAISFCQASA